MKYEFRRVTGRHGKIRRWTAQSIPKTILEKKCIYVILGKSKWANVIHAALIKRIKKASCVGEELEIYSKVAQGMSKKDHAISIRNDENGVRLFDNACTNGGVECNFHFSPWFQ